MSPKLAFVRLGAVIAATAKRPPGKTLAVAVTAFTVATVLKEMGSAVFAGQSERVVVGVTVVAVVFVSIWFVGAVAYAFLKNDGGQVGVTDVEEDAERPPFYCHVIDSVEGARNLTREVASKVFPDSNIPLDVVEAAQQRNNRRLIALVERASGRTVGWTAVWPVTAEAGHAIETGVKPDDELILADLLSAEQNGKAEYIVILAVGLLPAYRNLPGGTLLRMLGCNLLWHIYNEFYEKDSKALKLIAIGDSPVGEKMCTSIGLESNGYFARFAKLSDPKPIFSAVFTRPQLAAKIHEKFN